jgi:tRNA(Ile)-lysidine synthase
MANTRKSPRVDPANAVAAVAAALAAALAEHLPARARLAVALSGGIDSMVLLDAAAEKLAGGPIALSAIHVHHGLSTNAERWAQFCAAQCARRGVPLTTHRLRLERTRGASLEALARSARYACLLAAPVDAVALAHHADDQAETLLLQLLRGAGTPGLAAMPRYLPGRPALLRPLLGLPRATLAAYAAARALAWVDDESNADLSHTRNFLRHEIAPLLAARFPGYPATLVRAAGHQAEAAALADALAEGDAQGALGAEGLEQARLSALPVARARNLLRWFLRAEGLRPPTAARLGEMLRQLQHATPDARTRIAHDGAEIGSHRGRIVVHAPGAASYVRAWDGESELRLPGGLLHFERARGGGLAVAKLAQAPVTLRSRSGGERIRLAPNRPTRAVKKLLQEARMPPWERAALPLVWSGDELAAVPGIGIALAFQAAPDEAAWRISWQPARPA